MSTVQKMGRIFMDFTTVDGGMPWQQGHCSCPYQQEVERG